MWDEDPRVHDSNWRALVWLLKSAVVLAAGLSLVFGTWEPLLGLLGTLGVTVGALVFCWAAPMWLLGQLINRFVRDSEPEKSLKPRPD